MHICKKNVRKFKCCVLYKMRKSRFGNTDKSSTTDKACIGLCVGFALLILVIGIIASCTPCIQNFTNVMKHDTENMENIFKGGVKYVSLKPTDSILDKLAELKKNNKTALIVATADWCGYCKKLKASGELSKVAKKYDVIAIDDSHPQIKNVMELMQGEGFPSLGVFMKGHVYPYKGERENITQAIDQLSGQLSGQLTDQSK